MSSTPEKARIYSANASSHDACAATHDQAVPYIYRRSTRRFYWQLLRKLIGGPAVWRDADVLELGCGTGTYTDLILDQEPRSFTGVDLSVDMLEQARRKSPDRRCSWVNASLEDFSKDHPKRFDVIFSFSFLHHLPSVEEGLDQIRGLLKTGGVYVALHEIILPRQHTWVEKLDYKLESVFGSGVNAVDPWPVRAWKALPGRLTGRKGVTKSTESEPSAVDYVDYQLNRSFDLDTYARADVEVSGYCYLAFPQLMLFDRPVNHRALVLRA